MAEDSNINHEIINISSDEEIEEEFEQKKETLAVIEDDETFVPQDEESSTSGSNDSGDEAFFPENPWDWWQHVAGDDGENHEKASDLDTGPNRKTFYNKINAKLTKATTTPLINRVFQECFKNFMDKSIPEIPCQDENRTCGKCNNCRNNIHFNGQPVCLKGKEVVKDDETNDDIEEDEEIQILAVTKSNIATSTACTSFLQTESDGFAWINESICKFGNKLIYDRVQAEDGILKIGDFVYYEDQICQIIYFFEISIDTEIMETDQDGAPLLPQKIAFVHLNTYINGNKTILGRTCDPQELFQTKKCVNPKLRKVQGLANVKYWPISKTWEKQGGTSASDLLPPTNADDPKEHFYRHSYDEIGKFELIDDILIEGIDAKMKNLKDICQICRKNQFDGKINIDDNKKDWPSFTYKNEQYYVGDSLFFDPRRPITDPHPPFEIGIIDEIKSNHSETKFCNIVIRILFRPDQVFDDKNISLSKDFNLVFWTNQKISISTEGIRGKCVVVSEFVIHENKKISTEQWSSEGENRFYFNQFFDIKEKTVKNLPSEAQNFGMDKSSHGAFPNVEEPLKCLDVFAGGGGLSSGLHKSDIFETKWAIEYEPSDASTFQLNNPQASVFVGDANNLLKLVMEAEISGEAAVFKGQMLPKKGEVEVLCGGPPCQGFTGLNRHWDQDVYYLKNSLVATYLSFCDFYRPKFFIMENVLDFARQSRNSIVLQLCLQSLKIIGYSCSFQILNSGHFGVAQDRKRCIILASAPGYPLPKYPQPLHAFTNKGLSVNLNNIRIDPSNQLSQSAPYRTVTIRDAINDLPNICNGDEIQVKNYSLEPLTHFQRMIRKNSNYLTDHVCKLHQKAKWEDQHRMEFDGVCSTILTRPVAKDKQGKVVHPNQDRVISVREAARLQGFDDTYQFHGNINEKFRQVGNAVPPPLAKQIGIEIRRALAAKVIMPNITETKCEYVCIEE